jgi:DNA-binding XRE family transcriptional regulator
MNWKELVLNFRAEHSLSQRKFAKQCGISPTTLERIEAGKEPSLIVKGKIEKVIKGGN